MGAIDTISASKPERASAVRVYLRLVKAAMVVGMRWISWRIERRRTRRALLSMTDDQLKDIGISRADAYREGIRSFLD